MRPIVIESDVAAASVVGISNNHNNCNKGTVSCFAPEVDVHETMQRLLAQEDTTNDKKITIDDKGPKRFCVKALDGTEFEVAGNQYISNLLQELALAAEQQQQGKTTLDLARIYENPVDRLSRMIKDYFWDGLTRTVDEDGIKKIVVDSKVGELGDSEDRSLASRPRIYVPYNDTEALEYFEQVARKFRSLNQFDLEVVRLPEHITPQYVKEINLRPGILCLAMRKHKDEVTGEETLKGVPFVVPGGRFNEMYGWDSYFESLGLIVDGRVEMAKNMVDNFVYQIKHYGKILNANRSYYLSRSQPPFLTSMALAVFEALEAQRQQQQAGGVEDGVINHNYHNHFNHHSKENLAWLRGVICTAINEYWQVWLNKDRYNPDNGLSRYHGEGKGIPPETEPTHFDHILQPYAEALGMTVREYAFKYINGEIEDEKLEEYFEHDRAVRESGHDTSYRLEAQCAHLNTVDLNSLLYKYEVDIARTIETLFGGTLEVPENGDSSTTTTTTTTTTTVYTSEQWYTRAERRKAMMHELMWDEETGFFYDYNFKTRSKTGFESATTFYALWAGVATPHQAQRMVERALPLLEAAGGLVGSTERSRGVVDAHRVPRQWDFPYGWAPHQMLAWVGLAAYGYEAEAQRLAYRWLYMIARNAADYNGTVPEKYDVVSRSHKCFVEYGNVGTEFDYITHEGFGWMNASFQVGLKRVLQPEQVKRLRELIPAEWLFGPSTVARDSTNFTNAAVSTTSHNNNNNNNDEYHSCS